MNRNIAIAFFALSTLAAAGRAVAQAPAVEAKVPFEFTVGDKLLPANTYIISSSSPGVVTIESADKRFRAITVASHGNDESTGGSKLIFEKYGDRYFLHELLNPNVVALNVNIPKSKLQKQLQIQEAKYGGQSEVALVASR